MRNFNMNSMAPGTLEAGAKVQYLRTLVRGEALRQFDSLSADMESFNPLTMKNIIKGLASCCLPVHFISKQKRTMRLGTRKPCGFKVRCYATILIDLNDYLDYLSGDKLSGKIGVTELNEILLNSMPNSWSK